jgi:predicted MFS family arabinose efflux permease
MVSEPSSQAGGRAALWALLFGNMIAGTGVLLPAGLLVQLMDGFAISPARAGLLVFVGGIVVGAGAPLLAWITSGLDRRLLLVLSLALYAACHALSAAAPGFDVLLWLRALTMVSAAVFTPQAASTIGLIVSPHRRPGAVAFIFIGWSLASVAGIPVASLTGAALGWRATYLLMAGLSATGAFIVWSSLPRGLHVKPIQLSSWSMVFSSPVLILVLLVTLLNMSGQFTLFSYIAPVLKLAYGAGAPQLALSFAIVGGMGVAGNYVASIFATRLGVERSILLGLALVASGLAAVAVGFGNFGVFILGGCLWGLGSFSSNSLQQSRLMTLAPALAPATVALNTSVVYLGQAIGSSTGGLLIAGGPSPVLAWSGAAFIALAIALSVMASRISASPG